MVFLDKSLVYNGKPCNKDSDCKRHECQGTCHPVNRTCQGPVRNNNLQGICEKIFIERRLFYLYHEYFGPGLLRFVSQDGAASFMTFHDVAPFGLAMTSFRRI